MWLYVGIAAGFVVLIYLLYYFVNHRIEKQSKFLQGIRNTLEMYGTLKEEKLFPQYTYRNQNYYLLMLRVNQNAKFTLNSRTIWEQKQGAKIKYTDQTVFTKLPGKKIVIIYPNQGPFMYYYDEHEIKFIKSGDKIYDMYIINSDALEDVLKEGIIK